MLTERAVLLITTETPLHAGGGASLGAVDLPIQRERHTQYPLVQASGIKGALRDLAYAQKEIGVAQRQGFTRERRNEALDGLQKGSSLGPSEESILSLETAFGPETDRADAHAGALVFSDARLLLFPVRSLQGVFAWVTSPLALSRFAKDLERANMAAKWKVPTILDEEALTGTNSTVRVVTSSDIVLEECAFSAPKDPRNQTVDQIAMHLATGLNLFGPSEGPLGYWRNRLWGGDATEPASTNLVILSDTAFRDFVVFSTEVVARIRVNPETGTVASGALWSEEHLPSDTVLYSLVLADDPRGARTSKVKCASDVLSLLRSVVNEQPHSIIQLGGDETVGRGFVRMRLAELPKKGEGGMA